MLSISNVTPDQGANYFKEENYYSQEEAKEQSQWFGKGAAQFGLDGHVEGEAFKNLLHGKSPDGKKTLSGKKVNPKKHRAGSDLTFSAPKSVSLAALMGGQKQLEAAHRRAVERVLKVVEQKYAQARVWDGKQQKYVNTDNLIVAQFHHTTSREKDPQLHTHCVILNCTQLENGQWRALSNEELYNNKMLLGAIYRNELAYELRQLGYEIEPSVGELFEIKGYSQFQLEWFSKRRQQILELVGPNATAAEKEWATLQTRAKKGKELPCELQLGWWQAQNEAFNLQIQHPIPQTDWQPATDTAAEAASAVEDAIEHCSERTVAFKQKALEKFIFAEIKSFSYAELEQALARDPQLIPTFDGRLTTQSALARELATIKLMQQGQGQVESIVDPTFLNSYLSEKNLTQGQWEAIALAASTTDQFVAWQGVAGAGKTFALNEVRQLAQAQGYVVKGFAPSSEAAKVLGEEVEIESTTLASLLVSKQPEAFVGKQLWLVDEFGLVSAKDGQALLQRATQEQARIILIGDTRQLSAVEAGNPFKSLQQAGIKAVHLNQSLRQRTRDLKEAVDLIAQSQVGRGLGILDGNNRITEITDQEQRLDQLVEDYMSLPAEERAVTLILAGTNQERLEITQRIRKKLKEEGVLSKPAHLTQLQPKDLTQVQARYTHHFQVGDVVVPTREYKRLGLSKFQPYVVLALNKNVLTLRNSDGVVQSADPMTFRKTVYSQQEIDIAVGDRLRWTHNDRELERRNGQEFEVTAIENDYAQIQYPDGKSDQINLSQLHHLDYALVSTTYSSQGKTANRVLIAADQTMNKESFYVAVSRVKHDLKLYTADKAELLKLALKSRAKENVRELVDQPERIQVKATVEADISVVSVQPTPEQLSIPQEQTNERPKQPAEPTESAQQFQPGDGTTIGRGIRDRINTHRRAPGPHRRGDRQPTTNSPRTTELRPGADHPATSQPRQRVEPPILRSQRVSEQWRDIGSNTHPARTGTRRPNHPTERPNTGSGGTTPAAKPTSYQSGAEDRQPDRRIGSLTQDNEQLKGAVQPGVTGLNQRLAQNARPAGAEGERSQPAVNSIDRSATSINSITSAAEPTTRQLGGDDQPTARRRPAVRPRLARTIQHTGQVHEQLAGARPASQPTVGDIYRSDDGANSRSSASVPLVKQFTSLVEQPTAELQQISDSASTYNASSQSTTNSAATVATATEPTPRNNATTNRHPAAANRVPRPRHLSPIDQLQQASARIGTARADYTVITEQVRALPLTEVAQHLGLDYDEREKVWRGDGFKIGINEDKRLWNDWKNPGMGGIKGGGAINLAMYVTQSDFKQSRNWLAQEFGLTPGSSYAELSKRRLQQRLTLSNQEPPQPFQPPIPNQQKWSEAKSYLVQQRGLPEQLVDDLHAQGKIYASGVSQEVIKKLRASGKNGEQLTNTVFLRHNQAGEVTGAALRGVSGKFKGLAEGSQRNEGWFSFTQGEGEICRVVIVEAAIDALSAAALSKQQHEGKTEFLSTDGVGAVPTAHLQEVLERGGRIITAHDADIGGERMAWQVTQILQRVTRKTPTQGKDWNEHLMNKQRDIKPQQTPNAAEWARVAAAIGKPKAYIHRIDKVAASADYSALPEKAQSALQDDFDTFKGTQSGLWQWHEAARGLGKSEKYLQRITEVAIAFNAEKTPTPLSEKTVTAMQQDLTQYKQMQIGVDPIASRSKSGDEVLEAAQSLANAFQGEIIDGDYFLPNYNSTIDTPLAMRSPQTGIKELPTEANLEQLSIFTAPVKNKQLEINIVEEAETTASQLQQQTSHPSPVVKLKPVKPKHPQPQVLQHSSGGAQISQEMRIHAATIIAKNLLNVVGQNTYETEDYRFSKYGETVTIEAKDGRGKIAQSYNGKALTSQLTLEDFMEVQQLEKTASRQEVQVQNVEQDLEHG